MVNKEVEEKYTSVKNVLENALDKSNAISLSGEKENVELLQIRRALETLNGDFKNEIDKLENSSEWDKFCIAFFGETNAGKSTIIESLRIIYDEETRRAEVFAQKDAYRGVMMEHCRNYNNLISSLKEVNSSLEKEYKKNKNLKLNIILTFAGLAVGIIIGFILACLGIFVL